MLHFFSSMEEAFWNTGGEEEESANNGTDAPSISLQSSPDATEHIIEGSPLMMAGGVLFFVVMAVSLLSDALGDGVDFTFEAVGFPVIALLIALFGYARYNKTFVVSWGARTAWREGVRGHPEQRGTFVDVCPHVQAR